MVEVLDETIEPSFRTASSLAYRSRLALGRSKIASTIQSQSASLPISSRKSPGSISPASLSRNADGGSPCSMAPTALAAMPGTMSSSTT